MPGTVKHKTLALAALACLLTSCASRPEPRPVWLDRPAAAAPVGWWAAVGFGATPAEAHDDALVRLAQRVETRVVAHERFRESADGPRLDRRADVRTNVALTGAVQLAAHRDRDHAALVALDPAAAARAIAERADAALAASPPRLSRGLISQIERGAVLDPSAADWPLLRARVYNAIASAPHAEVSAPPAVAGALRDVFGPSLVRAEWDERAAVSHRPGERLRAWTLTAEIAGEQRRWAGVVADADPALAAAARLRAAATMPE